MNNGSLSLTTLFTNLLHDMTLLVRKELELARVETSQKVSALSNGAIYIAVGGALSFAALLFLLAAAAVALAEVVPFWASLLIIGGAVLLIGLLFVASGYGKFKLMRLKPERTVRTLRDDAAFARQHLRGG